MAKVLIVDHEANARDVVSAIVEMAGHEPETVADGHDALARFRRGAYDAVIVDFVNGRELVRNLREVDPTISSIMLTGELGAIAEVIEEIDLQVLPKPTALPILMTAIAVAIAKTHRAREGKLPNAPCRILVIDDDPAVLDFLCEALRESGCQVEGVTSGREGLSRIVMGAPDVVVLDLRMPDVDGQHILGRLRFFAPTLPVVVVTGYDDPSLAQQVLAAGAQHYLTKPVDLDRLGAAVADALSRGQRP